METEIPIENIKVGDTMTPEQVQSTEDQVRRIFLTRLIATALGEEKAKGISQEDLLQLLYYFSLGYCAGQKMEKECRFTLIDLHQQKIDDMVEHLLLVLGVEKKEPQTKNTETQETI